MPRPSGTRTSPRAAQTSGAARGSVSPRKRTIPEFVISPMIARMSVEDGDEFAVRGRHAGGVKGLHAAVARRKLLHLQDRMGRELLAHWTTLTFPLMIIAIRNGLTVMP